MKFWKNKVYALAFLLLGVISIWACDNDATFFIFSLFISVGIFFARFDVFDESQYEQEEYEYVRVDVEDDFYE